MEALLIGWIPAIAPFATAALGILILQYWSTIRWQTSKSCGCDVVNSAKTLVDSKNKETSAVPNRPYDEAKLEELEMLKRLYHQLHSLEKFPEVLPQARVLLLALLKETSVAAEALPQRDSILSIQSFSRKELEEFQRRRDINIGKKWERYNLRRKEGGARELFGDREEAIWWLKQIAPVKYVDGAWLGHVGKVTAPFALLKTMKGAWQILSEELGDGDLEKNHVHLYQKLLESVSSELPTAEAVEFGHPRHQLNELPVWKSAIAQLLVSLFPNEFLPEILGFNLHFEAVSMDTLKAGKELKEVGIDPYYFILHVSIDNADSGHTAIAIEVVCEYMDYVRRSEGEAAAQKAWRRLQAGYLLSQGLPGTAICPSRRKAMENTHIVLSPIEKEVTRIFKAKAQVVHGIHCSSKVRIGSRSVGDWLDPVALESEEWQKELLHALSYSKYWVRRGDSSKSRFIRELQWNGRMFGSFTHEEYSTLRRWIDNLPNASLPVDNIHAGHESADILSGYPVFKPLLNASHLATQPLPASAFSFQNLPSLRVTDYAVVERLLPLWLSHPCLLQSFVSVPFKTKNKFVCTIIKILRAQGGFDIEQECVAGMGEVRRPNSLGLAGIGMNMIAQAGLSLAEFASLKHVLQAFPSDFAIYMLHISMRPIELRGHLLGMATAFAVMHVAIARSHTNLVSASDRGVLQKIAQRELECLKLCWEELDPQAKVYTDCCEAYLLAGREIEKCFGN